MPKFRSLIFLLLLVAAPSFAYPEEHLFLAAGRRVHCVVGKNFEVTYSGAPETAWVISKGDERKKIPLRKVKRSDGRLWERIELQNQVLRDHDAKAEFSGLKLVEFSKIVVEPDGTGWENLKNAPYVVKVAVAGSFWQYLRDKPEAKAAMGELPAQLSRRDLELKLGLISPGMNRTASELIGWEAPEPFEPVYYPKDDPDLPDWQKPGLIVVHASEEFHYPATAAGPTRQLVKEFRDSNLPVAFLVHSDLLGDATYYVEPGDKDSILYSETGQHPLGRNCPEITFAGGHLPWCLGVAVRSYIANYFKDRAEGTVTINWATDAIYHPFDTGPGTESGETAAQGIRRTSLESFIEKEILKGYLEGESLADFQVRTRMTGRIYPFLTDDQFRLEIQVNGKQFGAPRGDIDNPKTLIFNVILPGV